MNAKNRILKLLQDTNEWLNVTTISERAQIGQVSYASKLLNQLIQEQKVLREKQGREAFYHQRLENIFFEETLSLHNVDEAEVFERARRSELYPTLVSEQADTIFAFAFTEMLNNAKDHSHSGIGYVKLWEEQGLLRFIVKDSGIGVFRQIKTCRHLDNETEAIQDLMKGKVTTAPRHHSGEGIFWTSKMADRFGLISYNYALYIDNTVDDYTIAKNDTENYLIGTQVEFEIAARSTKSISQIFQDFSLNRETYSFDTTKIPLKLYSGGDFWISRSQAKRVLSDLDKYHKIIIDFKGINLIGQGFADEIFRVFPIAHPDIIIEPINMNENVRMMVERALHDRTGRQ